jgi:hypothetical protein
MKRKIIIGVIILIVAVCSVGAAYIVSPVLRMTWAYKNNVKLFEDAAQGNSHSLIEKLNDMGFRKNSPNGVLAFRNETELHIIGHTQQVFIPDEGRQELRYEWIYSETEPESNEIEKFWVKKSLGDNWYISKRYID